jgi:hypothetical protein
MKLSTSLWVAAGTVVPPALLVATALGPLGTTSQDFDMPGTQPGGLNVDIEASNRCDSCHGFYDEAIEPHSAWAGGMMAQSMRDPIFHATLAIAEQDAPGSGNLCLRCHSPKGWLEGRATPTDGSALVGKDFEGATCNFCHRMVDPVFDANENPAVDAAILASLAQAPEGSHSGQFVIDPEDRRRGPFDLGNNFWWHEWEQSPFHQDSAMCASCHDVSNPSMTRQGGAIPSATDAYDLNTLDRPHPTGEKTDMFPLERTFSEWENSAFAVSPIEMGGRFGGNKTAVSSCQDCHMPDLSGEACAPGLGGVYRDDLPDHGFAGSNSWVPLAIHDLDLSLALYGPNEASYVPEYLFQAAVDRNKAMLAAASDLELTPQGNQLKARIVNHSGHKLPTGYQEGRRMWVNAKFFDRQGNLLAEHGAYDPIAAVLDEASTKVYHAEFGPDAQMANLTGLPLEPSFHVTLNNKIYLDNRIPPRGFNNQAFEAAQAQPVAYAYADGQYWDDTVFPVPAGTSWAEVRVFHQTTTKKYIEFLRDTNITNQAGQIAYDAWLNRGKSLPVEMDSESFFVDPHLSVSAMEAGSPTTLTAEGCDSSSRVLFAYSLAGPGPTNTPFGSVDLTMPIQQLGSVTCDSQGRATKTQTLPPNASGLTVYLQAAEINGATVRLTNSFAATVQ